MSVGEFRAWLNAHSYGNTQKGLKKDQDILDDCFRIERIFGDLDEAVSEGVARVREMMRYSMSDRRSHLPPPAGFVFEKSEDVPDYYKTVYEVMSSLRSAFNRYVDFATGVEPHRAV